jgi:hypothetical protein
LFVGKEQQPKRSVSVWFTEEQLSSLDEERKRRVENVPGATLSRSALIVGLVEKFIVERENPPCVK